jgi:hypothetical protein
MAEMTFILHKQACQIKSGVCPANDAIGISRIRTVLFTRLMAYTLNPSTDQTNRQVVDRNIPYGISEVIVLKFSFQKNKKDLMEVFLAEASMHIKCEIYYEYLILCQKLVTS